ncbi:MAG TPA: TerC family protein [Casimicrobiaceae bacterium]
MLEWSTPQFWLAVSQIIAVNILLSGDNAVVIALACRNLSPKQRKQGIFWGVVGAIGLRIGLTFFAMTLLSNPYLKLVGGVLLIWIGIKLVAEEDNAEHHVKASDRLLAAVWTIIVADVVMSLDNVMGVAAAAKGSVPLIVFGLAVSIPIVVFGSQVIMRLVHRFPILVLAGGGLLGYIAGEMMVEDPAIAPWVAVNAKAYVWLAPVAGVLVVLAAGLWLTRQRQPTKA